MGVGDRVGAARTRLTTWFQAKRTRHHWVDHLALAAKRYQTSRSSYAAAAITYFSFLSLFPLVLLAVAIAGFVFVRHPDLLARAESTITDTVPGPVGETLVSMVDSAIDSRGTIGVIGLLGTLYAGLGWVANVRAAAQAVFGVDDDRSYPRQKLGDLAVLVGLGLVILTSFGLTAGGTVATSWLVRTSGLEGTPGAGAVARLLGLLVATVGDVIVFAWVFVRLPRRHAPVRQGLRGAVFAAVGFEILKVVGAYYARRVSQSPAAGIFGNALGLLVWLNLFARFLLFAMAWTATGDDCLQGSGGTGGLGGKPRGGQRCGAQRPGNPRPGGQ